jgi:hypothetical protein
LATIGLCCKNAGPSTVAIAENPTPPWGIVPSDLGSSELLLQWSDTFLFFRHVVSVCLDFTQFGIAVVLLLLASNNIHNFLKAFFDVNLSFCILLLTVAVCLLPITMLKSPKDFW